MERLQLLSLPEQMKRWEEIKRLPDERSYKGSQDFTSTTRSKGAGEWQRDKQLDRPAESRGGRRQKRAPEPKPKRPPTDPVEQLSRDVHSILNKITPQTFDKLTAQLQALRIEDNTSLEKVSFCCS